MIYTERYLGQSSQEGRPPPSSIWIEISAPQRWTIYCHLTAYMVIYIN